MYDVTLPGSVRPPCAKFGRRGADAPVKGPGEEGGVGEAAALGDVADAQFRRREKLLGAFDAELGEPVDRGLSRVGLEEVEESRAAVAHVRDQLVYRDLLGRVAAKPGDGFVHQPGLVPEIGLLGRRDHREKRGEDVGPHREPVDEGLLLRGLEEVRQAGDVQERRFPDGVRTEPFAEQQRQQLSRFGGRDG